jgi:hypothetical protein
MGIFWPGEPGGHLGCLAAARPSKWVFEEHASLAFGELRPRLIRESSDHVCTRRAARCAFTVGAADNQGDVGLSGRCITSTVTLDAVNPDFSQVESDVPGRSQPAFDILLGEGPFFMEGSGIFTLAGQGNDNSLQAAVHNAASSIRRSARSAAAWGGGRSDRSRRSGESAASRKATLTLTRTASTSVACTPGSSNYVGTLAVDTEFAGGYNRVVGQISGV